MIRLWRPRSDQMAFWIWRSVMVLLRVQKPLAALHMEVPAHFLGELFRRGLHSVGFAVVVSEHHASVFEQRPVVAHVRQCLVLVVSGVQVDKVGHHSPVGEAEGAPSGKLPDGDDPAVMAGGFDVEEKLLVEGWAGPGWRDGGGRGIADHVADVSEPGIYAVEDGREVHGPARIGHVDEAGSFPDAYFDDGGGAELG